MWRQRFPQNRVARVVTVPVAKPQFITTSEWRPKNVSIPGRVVAKFRSQAFPRYMQPGGNATERKFFDTALSAAVDATAEIPTGGQLCLIPQGATQSTRVGRMCTIKSVQFNGVVNMALQNQAAASGDIVHMILVLDKQANGAAAAVTDVFTGANMADALINMANSSRFVILAHKRIPLQLQVSAVGTGTQSAGMVLPIKFYHKCNVPLEYSSTAGAITELKSNNLFWILGASFLDDVCTVGGNSRVRYTDD